MSLPTPGSNAAPTLPAAQTLAEVVQWRGQRHVHLPARFARATVLQFLIVHHAGGEIIEGPTPVETFGRALRADQWAIRVSDGAPLGLVGTALRVGDEYVWIMPLHTLIVATAAKVGIILRALEHVKPTETDTSGRPLPWVPERVHTESLATHGPDDDATLLGAREPLPPVAEAGPDDADAWIPSAEIHARFKAIAQILGCSQTELTLTRGNVVRHGFVTGRVWFRDDYVPLRVHLTTCPNSDWAEVLATIVHELAHPLSRSRHHGEPFKQTLVQLAERRFGGDAFREAKARVEGSYRVIDMWLASGIRAALRGGEPPVSKDGDDGQMARVLTKIKKLRELGANQRGLPEGIVATATANDLITTYGLEDYGVRIDGALDEQMLDRWVVLEDGAVWRRTLAHAVAKYCEVFSLAIPGKARMHFFGTRADVIAAEYIYAVSAARIARECIDHLAGWKRRRGKTSAAETVREKTSFCDCAAMEFRKKLVQIGDEEGVSEDSVASERGRAAAEAFARSEHERRGERWSSGGGKHYRENAAGRAAGRAMEVVRGVDGPAAAQPLRLSRR